MDPACQTGPQLAEQARRLGPLPYSRQGLNPPEALASPAELTAWQVHAVDAWWDALGRPDPFALVEIGAGDGAGAARFLAARPECLTALRYVLVEEDASLRERQRIQLPVESPFLVLGPVGPDDDDGYDDDDAARQGGPQAGIGPLITALGEPPVLEGAAVVLAIGWAGRLPSDRLEWRDGKWWEIRLTATSRADAVLAELPIPLDDARARTADRLAGPGPRPDGARYAQLGPALDWLTRTLRVAERGWLAVVDRWTDSTGPLTAGEVPPLAYDQLASVRRPIQAAPVRLFPGVSMVSWRLG